MVTRRRPAAVVSDVALRPPGTLALDQFNGGGVVATSGLGQLMYPPVGASTALG
jgi:hypothetical protein